MWDNPSTTGQSLLVSHLIFRSYNYLYSEEEMLGSKDSILCEEYEEAFSDFKYSFIMKLFLRFLLTNDSDERPDFLTAKKVFDKLFMHSHDTISDLSDVLEATIKLDTCS